MDDKNYDNNMSLVFSELNHMPCDRAYCSHIFSIRFNAKRIYTNNNICIYIAQYPANTACSTRL